MRARCLAAAGVPLILYVVGCGDVTVESLPLDVSVTANQTRAAPGDSIEFEINAQGQALVGVTIDWGDGNTNEEDARGARTLRIRYRRAYEAPGAYELTATVQDAFQGHKTANLSVIIAEVLDTGSLGRVLATR